MPLVNLPTEVLLAITPNIQSNHDLNSLAQTNRILSSIADDELYRRDGQKAMSWAIRNDQGDTARKCLAVCQGMESYFRRAVTNGAEKVVQAILEQNGANADVCAGSGSKILSYASMNGWAGVIRLLLARDDVDPNAESKSKTTPLIYAAHAGHTETVKALLSSPGIEVDHATVDGNTALRWSALLSFEARPDEIKHTRGSPSSGPNWPCHAKCKWKTRPVDYKSASFKSLKLLVAHPAATVDFDEPYLSAVLKCCAEQGYTKIFRVLIKKSHGAGADRILLHGMNLLTWAASVGAQADVIKIIIAKGSILPDSKDDRDRTPLSYAVKEGHEHVAKVLRKVSAFDVD